MRNPVLIDLDEFLDGFKVHFRIERLGIILSTSISYRKTQSFNGAVHSKNIFHRTEHTNVVVAVTVSLHTFEALHHHIAIKSFLYFSGIVEDGGSRVEFEVVVGNNAGLAPLFTIEINFQHVVRHVLTKTKLLVGNLGLGVLGAFNANTSLLSINDNKQRITQAEKDLAKVADSTSKKQ